MSAASTGLVLSGGGARGAYEVGVLSYIYGDLARREGREPRIDIICGTSVGAVNGVFLASSLDEPRRGVARLEGIWSNLQLGTVLGFGFKQAVGLPRVLLGGDSPAGIFDASPLTKLVSEGVQWRNVRRNIRAGYLRALTISATHVATGRPVVFVDSARDQSPLRLESGNALVRETPILPQHVLASAALPLIFPPVALRDELYCDGGLRLNTPMSPAIHLGAEKLLVVGVASEVRQDRVRRGIPKGRMPGAPFLLGKVLNAFLLDHVENDLVNVEWTNELLRDLERIGGPELVQKLEEQSKAREKTPRRIIDTVTIRPSVDLGSVAGEFLRKHRFHLRRALGRSFLRLLDVGEGTDADLASYLLCDGGFAQRLIELGRRDAAAKADELAAFLYEH